LSRFVVAVLSGAVDGTELRIREALAIRRFRPSLNGKEEMKLWDPHILV